MTNEQKKKIAELRSAGVTYAKIGEALGISRIPSKATAAEITSRLCGMLPPQIPLLLFVVNAERRLYKQKAKPRGVLLQGMP